MKTKIGIFLMVLGTALVVSALALFLNNRQEEDRAAQASAQLMPQLVDAILDQKDALDVTAPSLDLPQEMAVVTIDGHDYIGFVAIPSLELELPVMADWSYSQLQIAPCRFMGSIYTGDLVIMAHNYERHFGKLSQLRGGDSVTFTDVEGKTLYYEVVALDILLPDAVEDMTSGEYDLTLFSCTYGGKSRVTLRCDRVSAQQ